MNDKRTPSKALWLEFVHPTHHCCGLCGNKGIIDTRGRVFTFAGVEVGVDSFCICPNGRVMKRQHDRSSRLHSHPRNSINERVKK